MYYQEILISSITLVVLILLRIIIERIVMKRILRKQFDRNRRKAIMKIVNIILFLVLGIAVTSIWGIDQEDIILFVSSVLTILGVAFFAQWSHLSNITAGLIIFFDSTIKLGDVITILEKDFNITGKVEDIDAFSLKLKTEDGIISIPNNLILQKLVKIGDVQESDDEVITNS